MQPILIALILCSLSKSAFAQNTIDSARWVGEPKAVLGVTLGKPLEDSRLPSCGSTVTSVPCIYTASVLGPDGKPIYYIQGHPFGYAGIVVKLDASNVVTGLQAKMKQERFNEFSTALVTRYGRPTKSENASVQSQIGATFSSQTMVWRGQNVTILAIERFDKIDESIVTFSTNVSKETARTESEQRAKAAAEKL